MDMFPVTLDNCAQEPIHIPNRIQPNGFLLVLRIADQTIIQASNNTLEHLGKPADEVLGRQLTVVLHKVYLRIKNELAVADTSRFFEPVNVVINKRNYVCVPHCYQPNVLILEFENLRTEYFFKKNTFLQQLNIGILNIQQMAATSELVACAAKMVRQLTGYDRVMIYKFDQDYNGDVIAEEKKPELYGFLHHKFPASDIPKQARELYLKNWVRIINDVDYEPVSLVPPVNTVTNEYVDLSKSFLRSVSPIHIEYLKNMQVKATLTISIVLEGKLWGLIACHHYEAKFLNYDQRMGIEFLGKVLSHKWHTLETQSVLVHKERVLALIASIMLQIRFSNNLNETLHAFKTELLDITESEGLLIAYDDHFLTMGKVPEKSFCTALMKWLVDEHAYDTFFTNELHLHFTPAAGEADSSSGILTGGFDVLSTCRIIWFRSEYTQSLDWGGNPNEKTLIMLDDEKFRLSPRKSFDKWTEAVKNRSKDWEARHVEVANIFKNNLAEILAWRNSVYKQQKDSLEIEVKKKTEEITLLYDKLMNQYKKLEQVAFDQSHTVRAPLASLLGLIHLLETETDEDVIKSIHGMLKRKGDELDGIIRAIIKKIGSLD
jgi:light-regulated signal transduction histidine kinase (bacteriophytochrome)